MSSDALLLAVITSGLLGSVLTATLSKLLDVWLERTRYKRSILRQLYERKQRAAENVVSQWSNLAVNLMGLSALYERMSVEYTELDAKVFLTLHDSFAKELVRIGETSRDVPYLVHLYFDIELESSDAEYLKRFYTDLSALAASGREMSYWLDLYKTAQDTGNKPLEDLAWGRVESASQSSRESFRSLSDTFDTGWKDLVVQLRKIKAELKSHEF